LWYKHKLNLFKEIFVFNRINFNQLYYFYIVAKEGSIKSACEKLNLSQPAVSVQIKALEEEIGLELFVRTHRKIHLTELGKILKSRAESLFLLADQLVADLPTLGSYPKENFRLGVLRTIPSQFVMNFSIYLWQDHLLSTTIIDDSRQELIKGLDEGSLDFVLSDEIELRTERYVSINLGASELVAFSSHELKVNDKPFPFNLEGLAYLSFSTIGQTQVEIDHYFARNKISTDSFGQLDNVSLMKLVAEKNQCFSILPKCAIADELKNGTLKVLGEIPNSNYTLWGIFPKSSSKKNNVMKVIMAYLQEFPCDDE
jgi:LysR family transcriptional activator of nhaA